MSTVVLQPSNQSSFASSNLGSCSAPKNEKDLLTSEQWWYQTKTSQEKLIKWLKNQYHGEIMASQRLRGMMEKFGHEMTETQRKTVEIIADQESNHAEWVGTLLKTRGEEPVILDKIERYWDVVLTGLDSFLKATAVAAHAEEMRLERIRAIASDTEAPEDIKQVFLRILPQEEYHARAFRKMTSTEAYNATTDAHELGRVALGLSP